MPRSDFLLALVDASFVSLELQCHEEKQVPLFVACLVFICACFPGVQFT